MSSKSSGGSAPKGRGRQQLSPIEECIDLHINHNVKLKRAYDLTNPPITYSAIWERVDRIRKKAAHDAASAKAAKSPVPQAITTTTPTNLTPMSDITSSTTSSSKKRGAGKSVVEATKKAKKKEVIGRSLKLPSYVDKEKITSTMSKRTKRSLQQVNRDHFSAKAKKGYYYKRYKDQFKKATLEYDYNVKKGLAGKRGYGIRAVEKKYNQFLNSPNDKPLKKSVIQKYVDNGMAGKSPVIMGRPTKIPPQVTKGLAQHSVMMQLSGQQGEATGADMEVLATALTIGTEHEGKFNAAYAFRKARKDHPEIMQPSTAVGNEDRRAEWLTHPNINRHTDLVKKFLVEDIKFAIDAPGKILGEDSEITFHHDEDVRRFINLDETHHTISTKSDKGGSRTTRWTNSSFPRSGDRVLESSSHTTGLYMTNPVEPLPGVYIFETGAKDPENARMDPRWCMGLPKVTGIWGLEKPTLKSSYVCSRRKGSMEKGLWMTVIEEVIKPLYPNMQREVVRDPITKKLLKGPVFVKTDSGAGRLAQEAECEAFRARMAEQGLFIILGLPNGTAATQEMDQCYAEFQPACKRSTIRLASIKLKERVDARLKSTGNEETEDSIEKDLDAFLMEEGQVDLLADDEDEDTLQIKVKDSVCNVKLNNCDLGFIVNGLPNDPVEKKPFDYTFTPAKIWSWWVNVGFIPMNRNALLHEKVRVMLGEGGAPPETLDKMELLTEEYTANALELRRLGYNGQVFDAKIPVAKTEEQILEEDAQIDQLIDEKRLGSAGGMFKSGIVVANCDVVVKAAAKKKAAEEEKQRKKVADKELKDQNSESSAIHIYSVWKSRGKNMKNGTLDVPAPDLKKIFDFLIPKIDPSAKLSEYSTKQKRWDKLLEFGGRGTSWDDEMDQLIESAGRRERENAASLF